jgi:hypothetical protein
LSPREDRAARIAAGLVLGGALAACSVSVPTPAGSGQAPVSAAVPSLTPSAMPSVLASHSPSVPSPNGSATAIGPVTRPTTLLTLSGSGVKDSQPFTASGDKADLAYTFDCTSHGSAGHFTQSLYDRNGVTLDAVNYTLAESDKDSETIYLSNTAGLYHLSINSDCAWSVTVTGTPYSDRFGLTRWDRVWA